MMNLMQNIVFSRRVDDSKFQRKMASQQMELLRGYNLNPESTFHQSVGKGETHAASGTSGGGRSPGTTLRSAGGETLRK